MTPDFARVLAGVRAVVLDAGNTILSINYGFLSDALAACGVAREPDRVREAEWRARPLFDRRLAEIRSTETKLAFRAYFDEVLRCLGVPEGAAADAAYERVAEYNARGNLWDVPMPGAREAMHDIAASGLEVGVISNSRGTIAEHLASLRLSDDLAFVIDSGVVGIEKPDARIFALAAERLALPPDACLYAGDIYSVDVVGARGAGWRAVLVDPAGAFKERDCPRVRDVAHLRDALLGRGS